jgi:hypothetical protein
MKSALVVSKVMVNIVLIGLFINRLHACWGKMIKKIEALNQGVY